MINTKFLITTKGIFRIDSILSIVIREVVRDECSILLFMTQENREETFTIFEGNRDESMRELVAINERLKIAEKYEDQGQDDDEDPYGEESCKCDDCTKDECEMSMKAFDSLTNLAVDLTSLQGHLNAIGIRVNAEPNPAALRAYVNILKMKASNCIDHLKEYTKAMAEMRGEKE